MPRGFRFVIVLVLVLLLLHSVPWSLLVMAPAWPAVVTLIGTAVFALMLVAFPLLMMRGHGKRHNDGLAVIGDSWLGIIWQLFVWSTIGWLISFVLQVAGVPHLVSARWVAAVVGVWTVGILLLGFQRAMRVPPARETDVLIPRLGQGLDGLRLVIIADTHFGPIKRGAGPVDWSSASTSWMPTCSPTSATWPMARSPCGTIRSSPCEMLVGGWPGSTSPETTNISVAPASGSGI